MKINLIHTLQHFLNLAEKQKIIPRNVQYTIFEKNNLKLTIEVNNHIRFNPELGLIELDTIWYINILQNHKLIRKYLFFNNVFYNITVFTDDNIDVENEIELNFLSLFEKYKKEIAANLNKKILEYV